MNGIKRLLKRFSRECGMEISHLKRGCLSGIMTLVPSGCSSVLARALAWGARGRTFESCHSDHRQEAGFRNIWNPLFAFNTTDLPSFFLIPAFLPERESSSHRDIPVQTTGSTSVVRCAGYEACPVSTHAFDGNQTDIRWLGEFKAKIPGSGWLIRNTARRNISLLLDELERTSR